MSADTERTVPASEALEVPGPAGRLEALLEAPAIETPSGLGLLLHPHPLHQGTMGNKVVHTLARSFLATGNIAVRFNFRGVGRSEGSHGGGEGEQDDAVAMVAWMRREWPGLPLYLGGFSFGAMVALAAVDRIAPAALVTVAPPVQRMADLAVRPACPWLVVQGDEDKIVDANEVIDWLNTLDPGAEFKVMTGVDHFFHGRLNELRDTVVEFLTDNVSP